MTLLIYHQEGWDRDEHKDDGDDCGPTSVLKCDISFVRKIQDCKIPDWHWYEKVYSNRAYKLKASYCY